MTEVVKVPKWALLVAVLLSVIVMLTVTACPGSSTQDKDKKRTEKKEEKRTEADDDLGYKEVYKAGMHKVGVDIPPGEYVLIADGFYSFFSLDSSSSGEDDEILCNGSFSGNTILEVQAGQYLTLKGAYAVPIDYVKDLDTSGEGMFKVGLHIPAGEYKLQQTDEIFSAYYGVYTNARQDLDNNIVSNRLFEGSAYISVSNGQYLRLSRCKIVK